MQRCPFWRSWWSFS